MGHSTLNQNQPKLARKGKWSGKKLNEALWGWMFILPTVIGLIILNIIPIFRTLYQSFFKTGAFGKGNIFVGLENYRKMFNDEAVWQALINTFKYAIVEVPFSIAIALVLAVLLNREIKGRTIYRTIYFLPMVAAPAAIAMVWRWLYNSEFGLINHILNSLGLPSVNWISDPKIAYISIAIVGIWSVIGYNMILFLAGLQEIPTDYYEAAEIDGASAVKQFFSITIPLISPTMFFVTVTRVIAALQVFDSIYMMIGITNPALYKTQSLVYLFYKYSFVEYNRGYGSAIVMLLLAIIMIITAIQVICQKKWVNYN
ncbi:MAG: ABC-type transporter, integral rane subunit [Defluviitaleaceae bacterium]|jgi:multiple sugar transport system permease protein|uniref:ABC transporter permease subunit n=2 Tax=Defluviitalea raffinosedens TaxID=1450156 RepID=A0A7C8HIA0_9FIRM|nr:sugar ABC transporter permease [Defluviitalea raffinosedens]KAE9635455.1 ABC transporter permease subunit [Defluviitalea raffinosedens]MBZ4667196.1 ABC-type transporter, integral rane subunit [Defluviitaleaceae bacterium]